MIYRHYIVVVFLLCLCVCLVSLCLRRLLNVTALAWEGYGTPVLEALTYNRVVFIDCDRQRVYPRRLQHFVGDSKWATACVLPPAAELVGFVLPPAVLRVPNARVKQNLVALCMTFVTRGGAKYENRLGYASGFAYSCRNYYHLYSTQQKRCRLAKQNQQVRRQKLFQPFKKRSKCQVQFRS